MSNLPFGATEEQVKVLRNLAETYRRIAEEKKQEDRKSLWSQHNNLKKVGTPVICSWFWSSNTEWDLLKDECVCQGGILLFIERWLRNRIFHDTLGDDMVFEPWIPIRAVLHSAQDDKWGQFSEDGKHPFTNLWSENQEFKRIGDGWAAIPFVKDIEDIEKRIHPVAHKVNEEETAKRFNDLKTIFGDSIDFSIDRRPIFASTYGGCDLSEAIGKYIGIEELFYMAYDKPEVIHALAKYMQQAVLANFEQAEAAGDWQPDDSMNSLTGMPYTEGVPNPVCSGRNFKMKDFWIYTHGQEFTAFSPQMHYELLLQYQIPILEKFKYSSYGCCEDLTGKIDLMRKIPNLRRVAVAPSANLQKISEQVGRDYTLSWKPNPSMVHPYFDEAHLKKYMEESFKSCQGSIVDVILKDVTSVGGDRERLRRWTAIVKEAASKY